MAVFGSNPGVAVGVGVATGAAAKSAGSQPYAENRGGVLRRRVMPEHVNAHPSILRRS